MTYEKENNQGQSEFRSIGKRTVSHSAFLQEFHRKDPKPTLHEEYSRFLSELSWDYFFTGTFSNVYSANGARRACKRVFGSSAYKTRLHIFFIETGEKYGRIHVHGLLSFCAGYRPNERSIRKDWEMRYGYSRVEVPRSAQAVSKYCVKYVLKHAKDETYFLIP